MSSTEEPLAPPAAVDNVAGLVPASSPSPETAPALESPPTPTNETASSDDVATAAVKIEDETEPMEKGPAEALGGDKEAGVLPGAAAASDPGPPPDGGLTAWLQVLSNFAIHFLGVGFSNCFGLFIREPRGSWTSGLGRYYYQTQFFGPEINQTALSLMGGASQFISFIAGPGVGILSDRYGYMPVSLVGSICFGVFTIIAGYSHGIYAVAFIFQGVLQGVSFMASWIPSMGAVAQWWGKRRGLAIAIGGAGSGLGGLALSVLTQYLLDHIGLSWTLTAMGIAMLVLLVPASLMIKTRLPPKRRGPIMDWTSFKSLKFVALWLASFINYFAFPLPLFFLPSYATQNGISSSTAAVILGVTTATSAPARIFLGWGMDRLGAVNIYALACLVASIACFALAPFAKSVGLLFLFAIIYGASGGCFMTFLPVSTASLFGIQSTASKLGLIYLSLAVGALLGTFAGGQILTANTTKPADGPPVSNYTPLWMFVGSGWACGFLLLLWLKYLVHGWKFFTKV